MATGFVKNAHRVDPYKNYKFRIIMDERVVLGVSKVGALKRTTEVVKYRSGGENSVEHNSPGRTSYDGITLERGITHDREFESWANQVHPYEGDSGMDLTKYKKKLTLEVLNEKGQIAFRYILHQCWVSEYTAMPDLDASANAVAVESMKIELEGWEREADTQEPDEAKAAPVVG
jgi:phage tail-like protein